jgi:opacity protein-like surface antigen
MRRTATLTAAACLLAPAAIAQDGGSSPYLQFHAGANSVSDIAVDVTSGPSTVFNMNTEYGTGYGFGVAGGYDFGEFRIEGEVAYRTNPGDQANFRTAPSGDLDGEVSALTIMVNAYYDFETNSRFTPYLGAGLGAGQVELDLESRTPGPPVGVSGTGWGFAAQGIAGAGYEVSESVEVFAEARAMTIIAPDVTGLGALNPTTGATMEDDYTSYGVFAGVRFRFPPNP